MKFTKKEWSWILYDGGNSAYSIAITTALFPAYYSAVSATAGLSETLSTAYIGYANSFASLIVAILSPILGTIADYKDRKKRFFLFFALLGIVMTLMLSVVPDQQWLMLLIIYVVTAIGFAGANIFYDAFLVDVSENERMDQVSTNGFAFGYILSIIPFAIAMALVLMGEGFGLSSTQSVQIGFVITSLWWGLFTIPMIRNVRQEHYIDPEPKPVINSFKRLGRTFRHIRQYKIIAVFLIGYFFYIDGVDTIIKMATPFGLAVGVDETGLLLTLLGIQVVAFPATIIYGLLSKKFSGKRLIIVAIITYIAACIYAFFMNDLTDFIVLAFMIASAQGGIQALSRSYFAKLVPKSNSNEFFGFYNIFGKFSAILGPSIMALLTMAFGDVHYAVLGLIPLFVIGLCVMIYLPDNTESIQIEGEQ
jgi:UMF1 family MFS transporter